MPINTTVSNFETTLEAGFSQTDFITWLKNNFIACGFTNLTESSGNDPKYLAYTINFNNSTNLYDEVVFILHIPQFTNGTNFFVTAGLATIANYDFTSFRYKKNYIKCSVIKITLLSTQVRKYIPHNSRREKTYLS